MPQARQCNPALGIPTREVGAVHSADREQEFTAENFLDVDIYPRKFLMKAAISEDSALMRSLDRKNDGL